MNVNFYLRRPEISPEGQRLRKKALAMYAKGTPVSQIREMVGKHKTDEQTIKYLEKLKAEDKDLVNDPKRKTAIYALASYNGQKVKIYTGEKIAPKHWNPETGTVRNTAALQEAPEFRERINRIRGTIEKVFKEYQNRNDHKFPTPGEFKDLVDIALNKRTTGTGFMAFFEEFVKATKEGRRMNPDGRTEVREIGAKGYNTTLTKLKEFSKDRRYNLEFDTIDLRFYDSFVNYLKGEPNFLSPNTIGSHIQRIKAVMSDATERGYNTNFAFKSKKFVKITEETDKIYLNDKEIEALENLDLSDNERLDNARDWFLLGYYTGQRVGDFLKFDVKDVRNGFWIIQQSKGKKSYKPLHIPIRPKLRRLLEKRGWSAPREIAEQKLNAYIKEVAELIPELHTEIEVKETVKGTRISVMRPKYSKITSHTARRSYVTNETARGTVMSDIMKITGHRTEKVLKVYDRERPDEAAVRIGQAWENQDNKTA